MYQEQISNKQDSNLLLRNLRLAWFGGIMEEEEGARQEPERSSGEALLGMPRGTRRKPPNLPRLSFLVYRMMITDYVSPIDSASSAVLQV